MLTPFGMDKPIKSTEKASCQIGMVLFLLPCVIISIMKSIKQISEEIGVSKTAVRKKIENLGIEKQFVKVGNKFLIDEKCEKLIKQSFDKGETKTESETKSQTEKPNDNYFSILIQELSVKNEQIAELQETVRRQSETIENLTRALEAQTALHAGQIQLQLQLEDKKKRPFWRFRREKKKNESE